MMRHRWRLGLNCVHNVNVSYDGISKGTSRISMAATCKLMETLNCIPTGLGLEFRV